MQPNDPPPTRGQQPAPARPEPVPPDDSDRAPAAAHAPVAGPIHPAKPGDETTPTPVNEWMQDA